MGRKQKQWKTGIIMVIAAAVIGICTAGTKNNSADSGWDSSCGGVDKSFDEKLLEMRKTIAPKFQLLEFQDEETGRTMVYNLFIPENYDGSQEYPLVMFISDGSTVAKDKRAPLMQGYGGIIWATKESQAENPCFILAPTYDGPENIVNDNFETSEEAGITLRLLETVIEGYNIDKDRVYATGQSMGCMTSFYLNITNPDLFAASLYVSGQWDPAVLEEVADDRFFYIAAEGDVKASAGMEALKEILDKKGAGYAEARWSAQLPESEQDELANQLIAQGQNINIIHFTEGSVVPEGINGNKKEFYEHMYGFDYGYLIPAVREWLFLQVKE